MVAAVARAALLPAAPTLSADAYRYVWDARVASRLHRELTASGGGPSRTSAYVQQLYREVLQATG